MRLSVWLTFLSLSCGSVAQSAPAQNPASAMAQPALQTTQQQAAQTTNFTSAKGFVLEEGTPVRLRINRTVSSADAHMGDTVDFEVLDDIGVNGTLVVPKGGLAFATVTEAQAKRRMARGGKLDINIDYVKLVSGEKAALRAVQDVKGGGHTGGMVGGMVATSLVFFPAAPFFLFMHGKDITIPKGTESTAYREWRHEAGVLRNFSPLRRPNRASAKRRVSSPRRKREVNVRDNCSWSPTRQAQTSEWTAASLANALGCTGRRGRAHRHGEKDRFQRLGAEAEGEWREQRTSQRGVG